ncbi:MAG TPA: erythromycin esterase family protein [Dehalococcoidia bacterium]|nr:erythromycin esterase family protein [Dehalococcoidia bacterium]
MTSSTSWVRYHSLTRTRKGRRRRATEMGRRGELNIGRLMRERHGDRAYAIGFTTYSGSVTAARDWGEPAEQRYIRPALPDSFEALFHDLDLDRFLLFGQDIARVAYLERAIGVVYRPEFERQSHYFEALIGSQFDAVVHLNQTSALEPLDITDLWRRAEAPPVVPEEAARA